MATWSDLPREIKLTIFQFVFDTPFIRYKPRDRRLKRDEDYEYSLQFRALYLVSKTFANPDELNAALLLSSTLVFRKATQIRRMISEMPISSTSNIRQIELVHSQSSRLEFRAPYSTFGDLKITDSTFGTYMPDLKKVIVSNPEDPVPLGEITQVTRGNDAYGFYRYVPTLPQPKDAPALTRITGYLLVPGSDTPDKVVENLTRRSVGSVAYRFMTRRMATPRSNPKRRVWPWIKRLVEYSAAKQIEVVFQISCSVDITYVYRNSPIPVGYCYPPVATGTMSTRDWILRVEHNEQEYQFYQDSARRIFPHEDINVQ